MSEIVPKVQNAARRYTFFIIIVKNYFSWETYVTY